VKVGDYVARITNKWQKHNKWMEFPDEKPEPIGIIIEKISPEDFGLDGWSVLRTDGTIGVYSEKILVSVK